MKCGWRVVPECLTGFHEQIEVVKSEGPNRNPIRSPGYNDGCQRDWPTGISDSRTSALITKPSMKPTPPSPPPTAISKATTGKEAEIEEVGPEGGMEVYVAMGTPRPIAER